MSKWVIFSCSGASETGKTLMWEVRTKDGDVLLGDIRWFGRWRTYAFFPDGDTIYEPTCLQDIAAFIKDQMAARKRTKEATP